MLDVKEIADGVFRVAATTTHRDCLDAMLVTTYITSEAALVACITAGMIELTGLVQDEPESPAPPVAPIADADDESF